MKGLANFTQPLSFGAVVVCDPLVDFVPGIAWTAAATLLGSALVLFDEALDELYLFRDGHD
jgi:hypothetical protein